MMSISPPLGQSGPTVQLYGHVNIVRRTVAWPSEGSQGRPSATNASWSMGNIGDDEATGIALFAADANAGASAGGDGLVIHPKIDSPSVRDQAAVSSGGLADVLDEAVREVGTLTNVSASHESRSRVDGEPYGVEVKSGEEVRGAIIV